MSAANPAAEQRVVLGRINGFYGVRGWVKVFSYTEPRANIVKYPSWLIQRNGHWEPVTLEAGRTQGKGVVAKLAGFDDRDAATALLDCEIAVRRDQLPKPGRDEFYWVDLEGLEVVTTDGRPLGRVSHLLATGANDVLVVKGDRERLIPFVRDQFVTDIDFEAGRITVDWDPEF